MNLAVVKWAAEECERQQSGEMSVYRMLEGREYVRTMWRPSNIILVEWVQILAGIVEPSTIGDTHPRYLGKLRKVPVLIDGAVTGAEPENIERLMHGLAGYWNGHGPTAFTPSEFYQEFERIHPFADGNGRVGAILYNWLNGTLDNPTAPPRYDGRR